MKFEDMMAEFEGMSSEEFNEYLTEDLMNIIDYPDEFNAEKGPLLESVDIEKFRKALKTAYMKVRLEEIPDVSLSTLSEQLFSANVRKYNNVDNLEIMPWKTVIAREICKNADGFIDYYVKRCYDLEELPQDGFLEDATELEEKIAAMIPDEVLDHYKKRYKEIMDIFTPSKVASKIRDKYDASLKEYIRKTIDVAQIAELWNDQTWKDIFTWNIACEYELTEYPVAFADIIDDLLELNLRPYESRTAIIELIRIDLCNYIDSLMIQ